MKALHTYLNFDGKTRDAMTFYANAFGAELSMQSFAESKVPAPPGADDRIMHARIAKGSVILMASDTMPGMPFTPGNNVHLVVECESSTELDALFAALGDGGKVTMDVQDTFWGARFGMLVDQFGVHWMFNYDRPKS